MGGGGQAWGLMTACRASRSSSLHPPRRQDEMMAPAEESLLRHALITKGHEGMRPKEQWKEQSGRGAGGPER